MGNTPALHSEGSRFKFESGDQLPRLTTFATFLSPSMKMSKQFLQAGHDHSDDHDTRTDYVGNWTAHCVLRYILRNGTLE